MVASMDIGHDLTSRLPIQATEQIFYGSDFDIMATFGREQQLIPVKNLDEGIPQLDGPPGSEPKPVKGVSVDGHGP